MARFSSNTARDDWSGFLFGSFPSSWPDTAPFSLLSFDATGKPLTRWRLALAQESHAWNFSSSSFLFDDDVLKRIQTASEELPFKGYWLTTS